MGPLLKDTGSTIGGEDGGREIRYEAGAEENNAVAHGLKAMSVKVYPRRRQVGRPREENQEGSLGSGMGGQGRWGGRRQHPLARCFFHPPNIVGNSTQCESKEMDGHIKVTGKTGGWGGREPD